jgi:L-malate glycosyltransferase
MSRLLILSDIASEHTQRWVLSLAKAGFEIGIFSLNYSTEEWYQGNKNIAVLHQAKQKVVDDSVFSKLNYLSVLRLLKRKIQEFAPDVVHAHYATSYGLLGVRSGFHPLVISVWGTDVFVFPKKSFIHAKLMSYIFSKATNLCSTSFCMRDEILKYTDKKIEVIPFGVDVNRFTPAGGKRENDPLVIGNIKALESSYGNNILLQAFVLLVKKYPSLPLHLLFVGDGSQRQELEHAVRENGLEKQVEFAGRIPHAEIEKMHQRIDIFVSPTIVNESFGVSLVESMACGNAVIASDTPGFIEVVGSEMNGFIVKRNSVEDVLKALSFYIDHPEERIKKGTSARKRVLENYVWENNVKQMMNVYQTISKN